MQCSYHYEYVITLPAFTKCYHITSLYEVLSHYQPLRSVITLPAFTKCYLTTMYNEYMYLYYYFYQVAISFQINKFRKIII